MKGFFLHLYGPMQSWADTGFGQLREAGVFPSRSAVIGLIAAAKGIPRGDERLVGLHETLTVHAATVRPGRVLRDFHTVETRESQPRTLTWRDYHHDAHFVVLVEGGEQVLTDAFDALFDPVYGTFLGRRSCPPALPLIPTQVQSDPYQELVDLTVSTATTFPNSDKTWRRRVAVDEIFIWFDGYMDANNLPHAFKRASILSHDSRRTQLRGPRRAYAARTYSRIVLPAANNSTNHDAFYHAFS